MSIYYLDELLTQIDERRFKLGNDAQYKENEIVLVATRFGVYKARVIGISDCLFVCKFLESNPPVIEEGEIVHVKEEFVIPYKGMRVPGT